MIDSQIHQPEYSPIISSFPESICSEKAQFSFHPEFKTITAELCKHGNSKLTPEKVELIWELYCDGETLREIEKQCQLSDNRVMVTIQRIIEWMIFMDETEEQEPEISTVVRRPFDALTDSAFIFSSWRKALWFDEKRDEKIANQFYSLASKRIKKILALPQTIVRIACLQNDPNHIIGYSVMIDTHLEWVYVKVDYRKQGIATLLIQGFESYSEPETKIGKAIAATKENHGSHREQTQEAQALSPREVTC